MYKINKDYSQRLINGNYQKSVAAISSMIFDRTHFRTYFHRTCSNLITTPEHIVETYMIQQNDRNGHIYIRVMKQHMP